ncbi:MAG: type IV secretory system conjugative DNA transfer family protein [Solirubrobacteraceae bacterium]
MRAVYGAARTARSSRLRRHVGLALWAAMLFVPTPVAVAALAFAGLAFVAAPSLRRLAARPHATASPEAGTVVLGVDRAGRAATLTEEQLAAHTLIVGASGAGKSTTMLTMLSARITAGLPVVALDMKGSPAFAATLQRAAVAAGRELRVWTLDGPERWNPLAHGNATSLKDMLIGSERFTEPHYQRAAERYLQLALQVLLARDPGRPVDLDQIVAAMEPRRLNAMLRDAPIGLADQVQDYLVGMTRDQVSAVRGLQTRLAVITESVAGPHLRGGPGPAGERPIDLAAGLAGGDVILLSLNSSVYGTLAAQIGALAVQSLVSAGGRRLDPGAGAGGGAVAGSRNQWAAGQQQGRPPAMIAIDEFSALGTDNLLALLARGREAGIAIVVATQEMVDLERAGRGFRDQVVGIVGAKIIHRQDVYASAEMVAKMAGTEAVWEETERLPGFLWSDGGRGTRRLAEAYRVHPNEIMTLAAGQAVVLTKLPVAQVRRVSVTPPRLPTPAGLPAAAAPPGRAVGPPERAVAPPERAGAAPAQPVLRTEGIADAPAKQAGPARQKPRTRRAGRRDGPARE